VDFGQSQIERATEAASREGVFNANFNVADCYALDFADSTFDRVFSHALMEHLSDPVRALREMYRVIKARRHRRILQSGLGRIRSCAAIPGANHGSDRIYGAPI
jgi:ubiquinone/menaquinone biosynthesis C-methylase UbiE